MSNKNAGQGLTQRMVLFGVFIVGGGLVQLWITVALIWHEGIGAHVPMMMVFEDGSLFFYAISFVVGAIFLIQCNPGMFHWTLRFTAAGAACWVLWLTIWDFKEDAAASLLSKENVLRYSEGREVAESASHLLRNYTDQIKSIIVGLVIVFLVQFYYELHEKAKSKSEATSVSLDVDASAGNNLEELSEKNSKRAQQSAYQG